MKIPAYAIRIILFLVFLSAAGVRFASTSASLYPYFPGQSAMNYRDALFVAGGGEGADLDRLTHKSNWPQGYRPSRVRPAGVELFTGGVIRTTKWLSDNDSRTITRRLVVFFFSLCVFTLFTLTRNLWGSQAAGLTAAALVAMFPPLVEATNGREFGHTSFALVVVTLHLLSLQRLARAGGRTNLSMTIGAIGAGITSFALMAGWELAPWYLAGVTAIATLLYPLGERQRRVIALTHFAVFAVAALAVPWASASRMLFSWQAALLVACCARTFLPGRPWAGRIRGAIFVGAATAVLTVLLTPLRAGAESSGLPGLEYAWYRLRFLFGRPLDPALLPDVVRDLWSSDHAAPGAHSLLEFFLPLLFFVAVAVAEARRKARREARGTPSPGAARTLTAAAVAALGMMMYTIDRGAIAMAVIAVLPFAALAGRALEGKSRVRIALTLAGALIVTGHMLWPQGRANAALQISRALGVAHKDPAKVMWITTENTDRELIRFVSTRTSTKDPILGTPPSTAVLLAFAGRTAVLLEGGYPETLAGKRVEMTGLFYGDEDVLFRRCREERIRYVLYSVDYLLDTTRYSPLYLAGMTSVPDDCVAVSMHFAPEGLTHFTLVYENDRYRLFRVTDRPEPVFITDHPPIYQKDILVQNGDTYESFRERIGRLLLVFDEAKLAGAYGEWDRAIARLTWCLQQAPGFTSARVALGAALLDKGQTDMARDVLMSVIRYAPDNADALYLAADAWSQLGERERALSLLQILHDATSDTELRERAQLLEALIRQKPMAVPDSSTVDTPGP